MNKYELEKLRAIYDEEKFRSLAYYVRPNDFKADGEKMGEYLIKARNKYFAALDEMAKQETK